jgi:hypothetical protein
MLAAISALNPGQEMRVRGPSSEDFTTDAPTNVKD